MEKCLGNKFIKCVISVIRWVPIVFVVLIVGWAYYTYVYKFCFGKLDFCHLIFLQKNILELIDIIAQKVIYLIIFHVLLLIFLWSYIQTVISPIGKPSELVNLLNLIIIILTINCFFASFQSLNTFVIK